MSDGGAFSSGFANAYRMMMDREEKKKAEEANRAIGQMYLESMRSPADAAVAPYQQNNIQAQDDAYRKQIIQESSAMASGLMNDNPNYTQKLQGQSAPVTPAIQQQFQATNQANLSQANTQAQSAEQMLALAKEKYGTAMFDRLGPIVASGKVPAQAMIGIIEKQIQAAEKTAIKQATANAVKILSDPKSAPEQKQAILGQLMVDNPQAARGLADAFGLKQANQGFTLGQGQTRYDSQGRPIVSVAPKPDKPGVTFSDKTFKDETGREYQLDSKGQRHYAPRPVSPKDTQLKDINDAENRELSYLRLQASQNKFPTPGQVKEMEKQARQIQMKYQGMREGMKQNKQQATGNIDLNNLTPEQLDQARQLKELGLTKEQIAEELRFRASGAKGR